MANYIDWYVVELERRLRGRMPTERVFTITSEVEDHLNLKQADLVEAGMDADHARRAAVESFGHADVVADEVLEGATKGRAKRAGWFYVLGATVTLFTCMTLIAFTGFEPFLTLGSMALAIPLVIVFCRGSVLACRSLKLQVALIGAIGTIAIALLLPFGFAVHNNVPTSRIWLRVDDKWMGREIGRLDVAATALKSGLAYYSALSLAHGDRSKVTGRPPRDGKGLYWKLPQDWNYDPSQLGIVDVRYNQPPGYWDGTQKTATVRVAMADWLARGPDMLAATERQIRHNTEAKAAVDSASAQPFMYSRVGVLSACAAGGGSVLVLIALNAVSVGLARWSRRRRTRRPVLA